MGYDFTLLQDGAAEFRYFEWQLPKQGLLNSAQGDSGLVVNIP